MARLYPGDRVYIKPARRIVTLVRRLSDIQGGWEVTPPVLDFRYWNQDDMKLHARRKKDALAAWREGK